MKKVRSSKWYRVVLAAMLVAAVMMFVGCSSNKIADNNDDKLLIEENDEFARPPATSGSADVAPAPGGEDVSGKPSEK